MQGGSDGVDDLPVARAPAQVSLDAPPDFLNRHAGAPLEQGGSLHDHARGTEAALHRAVLDEGFLQRVQTFVRSQTLDRRHVPAVAIDGEHKAGIHRNAVHDDGAGAALPLAATELGAGEMKHVAQHVDGAEVHRHGGLNGLAVQRKPNAMKY